MAKDFDLVGSFMGTENYEDSKLELTENRKNTLQEKSKASPYSLIESYLTELALTPESEPEDYTSLIGLKLARKELDLETYSEIIKLLFTAHFVAEVYRYLNQTTVYDACRKKAKIKNVRIYTGETYRAIDRHETLAERYITETYHERISYEQNIIKAIVKIFSDITIYEGYSDLVTVSSYINLLIIKFKSVIKNYNIKNVFENNRTISSQLKKLENNKTFLNLVRCFIKYEHITAGDLKDKFNIQLKIDTQVETKEQTYERLIKRQVDLLKKCKSNLEIHSCLIEIEKLIIFKNKGKIEDLRKTETYPEIYKTIVEKEAFELFESEDLKPDTIIASFLLLRRIVFTLESEVSFGFEMRVPLNELKYIIKVAFGITIFLKIDFLSLLSGEAISLIRESRYEDDSAKHIFLKLGYIIENKYGERKLTGLKLKEKRELLLSKIQDLDALIESHYIHDPNNITKFAPLFFIRLEEVKTVIQEIWYNAAEFDPFAKLNLNSYRFFNNYIHGRPIESTPPAEVNEQ